jgi:type II secretory pathway pseudopilin PulG
MTRSVTSERGMSLVEATIILLVLMLLTAVLAPSMGDFIADAKMVKVKEDCEAIGLTVMRLVHDVGPCLRSQAAGECLPAIYSDGRTGYGDWPERGGDMEEQFVVNEHAGRPIYPLPTWRGAYLSAPVGPDPWGTRYGVNVKFLVPPAPATAVAMRRVSDPGCTGAPGTAPGCGGGIADLDRDVVCLSGGPNQTYETSFEGLDAGGTHRRGDDFVYVIQGSQRPVLY